MTIGTLTMIFIAVLLVSLAIPALRFVMGLACLVLLAAFLIDIFIYGGNATGLVVDQLVIFCKQLYAAFDRFERQLPR